MQVESTKESARVVEDDEERYRWNDEDDVGETMARGKDNEA